MPRPVSAVKSKHKRFQSDRPVVIESAGLIDIHFHGAFGIDLMRAEGSELDELARLLARFGIAGFCPTTLSAPADQLTAALDRLGRWITEFRRRSKAKLDQTPLASPLGIHLEGPFISLRAAGAHPPSSLQAFSMRSLEEFWSASHGTLKIITLAADEIPADELKELVRWAKAHQVTLSLGHSHATETEARRVFDAGVTSVTHAWNALRFHHREAGILGAAIGRPDVSLELILDQIHVAPTVLRWTCQLHHPRKICFVSDCAPAAALNRLSPKGRFNTETSFGPLAIRLHDGAARLADGSLAGGGLLLTDSLENWIAHESIALNHSASALLRRALPAVTLAPLRSIGLTGRNLGRASGIRLQWKCTKTKAKLASSRLLKSR